MKFDETNVLHNECASLLLTTTVFGWQATNTRILSFLRNWLCRYFVTQQDGSAENCRYPSLQR